MKVIVLGAGVTTVWFLHKAGHKATVIDRQPPAGLEISSTNDGQISAKKMRTGDQALAWRIEH